MRRIIAACIAVLSLVTRTTANNEVTEPQLREMRGIWVASVANIDWPSEPGLSDETLMAEARTIVNKAEWMGMNAIFLQVRPASDAIYPSTEPLSMYLVGDDFERKLSFDALKFWIDIAHEKGIELHAWVNPFRVSQSKDFTCGEGHLLQTHPEWLIKYGEKTFLNPGQPEAQMYVRDIVMDIVNRYDVDGIHFDDYFYPYPVKGEVFADDESFRNYNPKGLSLDNWRRNNVTQVIRSVSDSIRSVKPWVQFGISPFGVWRNKKDDPRGSKTQAGCTNYDVLYADVLRWIDEKIVDYVIPQIYWESGNKYADFDELEQWWSKLSTSETRVFVGHAVYRINDGGKKNPGWNSKDEMPNQVRKVRNNPRSDGSVFFSYKQFKRADIFNFDSFLADSFYSLKTIQPAVNKGSAGEIEIQHVERNGGFLNWETEGDTAAIRFYVVYRTLRSEADKIGSNESIYCITDKNRIQLNTPSIRGRQRYVYRIAAVDKFRVFHPLSRRITIKE